MAAAASWPWLLQELLAGLPQAQAFPNLLVGSETADDAAVYRLTGELEPAATTQLLIHAATLRTSNGRTR